MVNQKNWISKALAADLESAINKHQDRDVYETEWEEEICDNAVRAVDGIIDMLRAFYHYEDEKEMHEKVKKGD